MAETQKLADRWKGLKLIIEHLYLKERKKVSEVAAILKRDHAFDMVPHQYRTQFKKWNWRKNSSADEKDTIVANYQCRAALRRNPTQITHHSPPIQVEKIRRHMKKLFRTRVQKFNWKFDFKDTSGRVLIRNGSILLFGSRLFRHGAKVQGLAQSPEVVDGNTGRPFRSDNLASDNNMRVQTPPSSSSHRPCAIQSTILAQKSFERALLLVQGRYDELMCSMDNNQRMIMSEWLSEYWFFSFKTVKYWGRGPQAWTGKLLEFDQVKESARTILSQSLKGSKICVKKLSNKLPKPGRLCGWLIHVRPGIQDRPVLVKYPVDVVATVVTGNPVNWDGPDQDMSLPDWSKFRPESSLQQKLQDALENNDFSTTAIDTLPVAIHRIAAAAEKLPTSLLPEALGFSIMSRNIDQLRETLQQVRQTSTDITSVYPLHLATSYLDGNKSCCTIIRTLLQELDFRQMYVNQYGHSVLDNLMITILRSHTSLQLRDLDDVLPHFEGEEVDICGRWDADSDCFRILRAVGDMPIPISWKHKFCHTSVQAICHTMQVLWSHASAILMSSDSGLYLRYCFGCGLKLQLGSLHAMVMTAFHLACYGCADEDMFGMLACVLCLISLGIDPRSTASISVRALVQGQGLENFCDHEDLTPAEFCSRLSKYSEQYCWSDKVRVGWGVLYATLHQSEKAEKMSYGYLMETLEEHGETKLLRQAFIGNKGPKLDLKRNHFRYHETGHLQPFGHNIDLATLWAAVQAELNMYRRQSVFHKWHSVYFSMDSILDSLRDGQPLAPKLAICCLLKTFCICGKFCSNHYDIATLEDVLENPVYSNYHSSD